MLLLWRHPEVLYEAFRYNREHFENVFKVLPHEFDSLKDVEPCELLSHPPSVGQMQTYNEVILLEDITMRTSISHYQY